MALTKKPGARWWSRLHFLVRFLGLTGLLAAGVGAALALFENLLPPWETARTAWDNLLTIGQAAWTTGDENVRALLQGQPGDLFTRVIVGLLLIGGTFTLL